MADHTPEMYTVVVRLAKNEVQLADALFEHLKKVPVFRDHSPKRVTQGEVLEKLDHPPYGGTPDDICFVISAHARTYIRSMQDLDHAQHDFIAGWNACKNKPPRGKK